MNYLEPSGHVEVLTFCLWVITTLIFWHSAFESYEIWNNGCVQSVKSVLWIQTSGPVGLCQTPDANLTSIMKNETNNPYLQWSLSHSLSPSLDNKWAEWCIHQHRINCEIKRSLFKWTLQIQGSSSQEVLICLFNEINHPVEKLFHWDLSVNRGVAKSCNWLFNWNLSNCYYDKSCRKPKQAQLSGLLLMNITQF